MAELTPEQQTKLLMQRFSQEQKQTAALAKATAMQARLMEDALDQDLGAISCGCTGDATHCRTASQTTIDFPVVLDVGLPAIAPVAGDPILAYFAANLFTFVNNAMAIWDKTNNTDQRVDDLWLHAIGTQFALIMEDVTVGGSPVDSNFPDQAGRIEEYLNQHYGLQIVSNGDNSGPTINTTSLAHFDRTGEKKYTRIAPVQWDKSNAHVNIVQFNGLTGALGQSAVDAPFPGVTGQTLSVRGSFLVHGLWSTKARVSDMELYKLGVR